MTRAALNRPHARTLTIVAQDPSVKAGGKILTTEVQVPAEELAPGPRGYRVNVIDYDVAADVLYRPAVLPPIPDGTAEPSPVPDRPLLEDPAFHAQNVYAIVMRILARFEFALGRRVAWGCEGHQLHIAPHAFAEPNAFYSRDQRGLYFGYFRGASGEMVYTCLSHDVIAHETTHAILDGLRSRYLEPSSPDQAAFHEGFSDVVALLSIFSLPDVVAFLLDGNNADGLIASKHLTRKALQESLLGLADQMGAELSGIRGEALRSSLRLKPDLAYAQDPAFQEPHRRGELLVAAMLNAFLDIWLARLKRVGFIEPRRRDRRLVVEEGARVADHLLTMAIRAIDYCPPTDLTFADYLSALLTIDREVVPDDSRYGYRDALRINFSRFGIKPAAGAGHDGAWRQFQGDLSYSRSRFDSMLRDTEEVFRFIWENREALAVDGLGYVEVQSVRPCVRIGPDGFILRETVAEYIQTLELEAHELKEVLDIEPPEGLAGWRRIRLFGGGALIFDEYGRLKHQIANNLARTEDDRRRQGERLDYLFQTGAFERTEGGSPFAAIHLARAQTVEARR